MIWTVLSILIFLSLITLHELGHFISGKLLGFGIKEFAVGFGPAILSKTGSDGVVYSLRALPLGGYCAFYDAPKDDKLAFNDELRWKRLIVLISGVAMNLITAIVLAFVLFAGFPASKIVVSEVVIGAPADLMMMEIGDQIETINGEKVNNYNASELIDKYADVPVEVVVKRNGDYETLTADNIHNEISGTATLGIMLSVSGESMKLPMSDSIKYTAMQISDIANGVFGSLKSIVTKPSEAVDQMSGLVGTISVMNDVMGSGYEETQQVNTVIKSILSLAVFLSVNLAIMNMLPIPGLDGGQIVFILIEMIIRKPLPEKFKSTANMIGVMLFFALFIYLMIGDTAKLLS